MIYLLLVLSFSVNILFIWYIRKLLLRFWYDAEVRKEFAIMLEEYSESLKNLYTLEEFHGEESIKRAIQETNFVIEAAQEFAKGVTIQEEGSQGQTQDETGLEANSIYQGKAQVQSKIKAQFEGYADSEEDSEEDGETEGYVDEAQGASTKGVIRLPEGQKVSQEAGRYRRVVPTG
jgi:hypothetical protein